MRRLLLVTIVSCNLAASLACCCANPRGQVVPPAQAKTEDDDLSPAGQLMILIAKDQAAKERMSATGKAIRRTLSSDKRTDTPPFIQRKGGPEVSVAQIRNRYGDPDEDRSTVSEQPRPLWQTRWLDYRAEKVRFIFGDLDMVDQTGPATRWGLMAVTDLENRPLAFDDLESRLDSRREARDIARPGYHKPGTPRAKPKGYSKYVQSTPKPPEDPRPRLKLGQMLGKDDYTHFAKLYGPPDKEGTDGKDKKTLYEAEKVKVFFRRDPVSAAPLWNVFEFSDTSKRITGGYAEILLRPRARYRIE
jgi:hypothetical protein